VQPPVPDRYDEFGIADGQRAGQMHRVRAPQSAAPGQLTGVPLHRRGQLNRANGGPELFPGPARGVSFTFSQNVIAGRRGQCGAHFRVGQAARHWRVASIPQLGRQVGTGLFDQQLHQCTGVEVHQWHGISPAAR
jgi:hypothetical protein